MADIIRVSITGSMPGGERWSINPVFALTSGAVITFTEAQQAVTAVNAITIPAGLLSITGSAVSVTGCRVEARTFGGVLEAQAEGLRTPVPGTGSSVVLPFQSSLVFSLRSVLPGARGRGRLYWPATGLALNGTTMRPNVGVTGTIATAAKTYLAAIESAVDGVIDETVGLAVWSRTSGSAALVSRILVGDIIDTQRRRRDSLPESYAEVSYP